MTTDEKKDLARLIANVIFAILCSQWSVWIGLLIAVGLYLRIPAKYAYLVLATEILIIIFVGFQWGWLAASLYVAIDFLMAYVSDVFANPFPPMHDN